MKLPQLGETGDGTFLGFSASPTLDAKERLFQGNCTLKLKFSLQMRRSQDFHQTLSFSSFESEDWETILL